MNAEAFVTIRPIRPLERGVRSGYFVTARYLLDGSLPLAVPRQPSSPQALSPNSGCDSGRDGRVVEAVCVCVCVCVCVWISRVARQAGQAGLCACVCACVCAKPCRVHPATRRTDRQPR
jgi:hypothetical protein